MWQNIAFYFKLDIFETLLSNPGLKPLIPNPLGQTPTQDLNPTLGLTLSTYRLATIIVLPIVPYKSEESGYGIGNVQCM